METNNEAHPLAKRDYSSGRDENGRFIKGKWRGGPGRPHDTRVMELRRVLLAAATPERMRNVVEALISQAEAGDVVAIRELLDRTIGKVTQTIETNGDALPIKLIVMRGEE